jgi:hypothetical protein
VGSYVTIMGNGFSTAPTGTVVRFNGTAAAIVVASTRELKVQVPTGATTGKITVQVAGVTAASPASFTVTPAPVTITSISPTVGDANTVITVSGAGFDSNLADNSARIGTVSAQVLSATTTRVTVGVPPTGASGPVSVMTPRGSATSAQEFVMAPPDIAASTVGTTYRMSIDGPDAVVTVAAGRVGLIVFDAEAGDALGLGMTATTFSGTGGATVSLYDTNGDLSLPSTNRGSVGLSQPKGWILPRVPTRGTYTLAIRPDAGVAVSSMTLTLTRALCGALTPGVVATFTTTRPGQFARCTFQPASTLNYTLVTKNLTVLARIDIALFDPSGSGRQRDTRAQGEMYLLPLVHMPAVPTSGDPYEVQIASVDVTKLGQGSVALLPDALSPITVDGPASTLNVGAEQGGAFVFSGQIGDRLGMGVSTWTTSPANQGVLATIYDPNGVALDTCSASIPRNCIIGPLKSTAPYSVRFEPANGVSATFTASLSRPLAGMIVTGGSAIYAPNRPGQGGRYTFLATAGAPFRLSFASAPNSFSFGGLDARLSDPNGGVITSMGVNLQGPSSQIFTSAMTGAHTIEFDALVPEFGQVTVGLDGDLYTTEVFNGRDSLNRRLPDWDFGYWKANCPAKYGITGLSVEPLGSRYAHAAQCRLGPTVGLTQTALLTGKANVRRATRLGDWDPGYYQWECGADEYVSGFSMDTTTRALHVAQCSSGTFFGRGMTNCSTRNVGCGDDRGTRAVGDWDPGFCLSECGLGQLVFGVSFNSLYGNPHRILCCDNIAHVPYTTEVFAGQNSNNVSSVDWDPGFWKANCPVTYGMRGLSYLTTGANAHAAMCKAADGTSTIPTAVISGVGVRRAARLGDWDAGFNKWECGLHEYVSGISMNTTTRQIHAIQCSAGTFTNGGQTACATRDTGVQDRGSTADGDWDVGFNKSECNAGQIIYGVSVNATTGQARKILCCNP